MKPDSELDALVGDMAVDAYIVISAGMFGSPQGGWARRATPDQARRGRRVSPGAWDWNARRKSRRRDSSPSRIISDKSQGGLDITAVTAYRGNI